MQKYYVPVIKTNNELHRFWLDNPRISYDEFRAISHWCEFDLADIVHIQGTSSIRMVVDDCGLMNDNRLNRPASDLYGNPIVGNVWFARDGLDGDIYPLEADIPEDDAVYDVLKKLCSEYR